jgi:RND family efflux transporter MFP subunit
MWLAQSGGSLGTVTRQNQGQTMMFSPSLFSSGFKRLALVLALVLGAGTIWTMMQESKNEVERENPVMADSAKKTAGAKPALTVMAITPQPVEWPRMLVANGNIAAWQEAVISAEISDLRLTEVRVNVGDQVQKGQVLARISPDSVDTALSESQAAVAEAEAMLAEAKANGDRARQYQATGFMSAQQINQYLTAEKAALARLNAARARMQANQLRLAQTEVRAPDAGVISARTATVGSMAQSGQELFRLIRGSRLEWRAEVSAADLGKLKPGVTAMLTAPDGTRVEGRVRMVAPTVDTQTLNGLVYVDLPIAETGNTLRAGTFARGEFELGRTRIMSLPQSAVLLRDGFSYVFRLDDQSQVAQTKVIVGQRMGDQIEIVSGIAADTRVVASGAGFLADGDWVRVVDAPETARKNP